MPKINKFDVENIKVWFFDFLNEYAEMIADMEVSDMNMLFMFVNYLDKESMKNE